MANKLDKLYENVPTEQVARLKEFRVAHPVKPIKVGKIPWEYIASGQGQKTLLFLTGGLRLAESAFPYILLFEGAYQVIAPTYPPLRKMDQILQGIVAILDAERVEQVCVLGQSYGGLVAQLLVRRYPQRVDKLILSSTNAGGISKAQLRALKIYRWLLPTFPERATEESAKKQFSSLLAVPEAERAFWDAYLNELFVYRMRKADLISHFATVIDFLEHYPLSAGDLAGWPGRVLILYADNDPTVTEEDRQRLQEVYPQAKMHIFTSAGHTVGLSRPEEYAAAVTVFLDE